jgi:DNA polymerase-3 subunit delta
LYGDEFLHRSAFKSVLNALIQPDHQDLNYEAIDGEGENVYEIIQHLNTFPLIPSAKVVAVHGTRIFYSAVVMDDLLGRSKEAFEMEDLEESARYLLYTFSMADVSLDDVREGDWKGISDKKLRERFEQEDNSGWLGQVIAHCIQEKMVVPVHQDDADVLNDAILSGYPETNYLVLTTDLVDKRRKLYKTIKKIGVVVDCSVPKGDRKADKDRQQAALKTHMKKILKEVGKRMASGGFESLYEKIGPDMRSFDSELEKVVTFVGDRDEILPADVENTHKALFFLDSLLRSSIHQLQVLAVVTNQIRKLILAKDFIHSEYGNGWRKDLSYAAFQKMILPKIEEREPDSLAGSAHPYAIYMTLKHSDNYTSEELMGAMELLLDTDIRLKSSGQNAKVVLEHAVLGICRLEAAESSSRS